MLLKILDKIEFEKLITGGMTLLSLPYKDRARVGDDLIIIEQENKNDTGRFTIAFIDDVISTKGRHSTVSVRQFCSLKLDTYCKLESFNV